MSFGPLGTGIAFDDTQFFANQSVELIRAGRIPGETAHPFAVTRFPWIESLSCFEALLGFAEPVHFQAQQSELVMGFTKLRIEPCGLSKMLDGAFVLSLAVTDGAHQEMNGSARLELQSRGQMFQRLLPVADRGKQRTQRCVCG